jgi:plasmid stabilization system protein ParE
MAKEIIWSEQAISDRKNILTYWILKNQSTLYSIKLDALFREAVKLLSEYPFIGKSTDIKNIRAKKVRDYFIFYQENGNQIHIVSIWDTRQNPASIKKRIRRNKRP